jgi:alkylation response protein AidB-like acyl-CoA dehydrogenase
VAAPNQHSSLAKGFVTSRMWDVVAWSCEIFAGNGILLDYGIARYFADAEALHSGHAGDEHPDRRQVDHRAQCLRVRRSRRHGPP